MNECFQIGDTTTLERLEICVCVLETIFTRRCMTRRREENEEKTTICHSLKIFYNDHVHKMLSSFRFVFLILLLIVVNNHGALGRQKKWPDRFFLQDSERLEVNLFNIVKGVRRQNDRYFVNSSAIKDARGGGEDISSFANTTLLVGSIDQLARSTSLFLGWVVAFQAFVSGISTHRDSLLEVCFYVITFIFLIYF